VATFTEEYVIEQVKRITGAESVRVESKNDAAATWSLLLSFPDGPDAYTFQTRWVDVSGEEIRMVGFNW
jgi:hypothetical protein